MNGHLLTCEVDREREVRTAFLALLRLEPAFINMRAFARARVKPNRRYAWALGPGRTHGLYGWRRFVAVVAEA